MISGSRLVAFAVAALGLAGVVNAGPISSSAVRIDQVDFRNADDSIVGEITIDRTLAGGSGYVNVVDPATNTWLVRNLPVFGSSTSYDGPAITTRMALDFIPGATQGSPIASPAHVIIDYFLDPSSSLDEILGRGTPAADYTVGHVKNAVGGVGLNFNVSGYQAQPDLTNANFISTEPKLFDFVYQPGHPNIQAGYNQCAPAAVANSLQFLENTTPIIIPDPDVPGFGSDGSLVGRLDTKTGRTLGADRRDLASSGVWPMDGKLSYIATNGLQGNLQVRHRGGGDANNAGTALNGGADYTFMGVTSAGAGAAFDIGWIISELMRGADIELDLAYQGPNGGRHYVQVVGAGYILGVPFLLHVSDKVQADQDPTDTLGTGGIDFEWINGVNGLAANSNAIIDQVVSESFAPCDVGSCPNGCCLAGTCTTPSVSHCATAGGACVACDPRYSNACLNGSCSCGSGPACSAGQRCANGTCVCDAISCPSGCCSGAICLAPSAVSCGTAGSACVYCGARADRCANGSCACGAGPACAPDQQCVSGACVSCDASTCPNGCCSGGICTTASAASCGTGGATCANCDDGNACTADSCDTAGGQCRHVLVLPSEVNPLSLGSQTTLSWPATTDATIWNTYRGTIPAGLLQSRSPGIYDQSCFENDDSHSDGATVATDTTNPVPATAFYFLVTGESPCGEGPPGFASSGALIPNATPCAASFCNANFCASGCCSGNTCMTSSPTSCGANGGACIACGPGADTCRNGVCACGTGPTCPAGQACQGGVCVCNSVSCPTGCCSGTLCITPPTAADCGANGGACMACGPGADNCLNGACACGTGPACPAGQSCHGGVCGCDSVSCSTGCCSGALCITPPTASNCGANGGACMSCGAGADTCRNGACACGTGPTCLAGQVCQGGVCVCNSASCSTGCCSGTSCISPPTVNSCGANGNACIACGPGADTCRNGACACGTGPACPPGHTCKNGVCS